MGHLRACYFHYLHLTGLQEKRKNLAVKDIPIAAARKGGRDVLCDSYMILAAAVQLLTAALMLLQLVNANPLLPQSIRDTAQSVAQNAITEATRVLGEQSITTINPIPTVTTYDSENAHLRHQNEILSLSSCGNGNDFYDGGAGVDTVLYTGKRSEFYITKNADGSYTFKDLVPCRADTDTVINVENFTFGDGVRTIATLYPDTFGESAFITSGASTGSPFAAYPASGYAPLTVSFSGAGNISGIGYGDGSSCTDNVPDVPLGVTAPLSCHSNSGLRPHTYTQPGTYTATATKSMPSGIVGEVTITVLAQ